MYLVTYRDEFVAFFFDELDALQYIQHFPEDQWDRYEVICVDNNRSSLMFSLADDILTNFKFESLTEASK